MESLLFFARRAQVKAVHAMPPSTDAIKAPKKNTAANNAFDESEFGSPKQTEQPNMTSEEGLMDSDSWIF